MSFAQHNADTVTHAFIANYALPILLGGVAIGLLTIAWEIPKTIVKRLFRKTAHPNAKPNRRYRR